MSNGNGNGVASQLYANGTVWVTSVKTGWSGKGRLTAGDLDKDPEEILDIFSLGNKQQLPKEVLNRIQEPHGKIKSLMEGLRAKPFLDIRSAWYVPDNKFLKCLEGMERIAAEHEATAQDVVDNIDEIKGDMIEKYPVLADAKWPTRKYILDHFKVTWTVCQISGTSINETDPVELREAKRVANERLSEAYDEYADQLLEKAKSAMYDAIVEIREKIETSQRITEATMNKPRRVIDDFLSIAEIFDLQDVQTEVEKLKAEMNGVNAKDVRENWDFARQFAESLGDMASKVGDLSGLSSDGTVKRVVRRAA